MIDLTRIDMVEPKKPASSEEIENVQQVVGKIFPPEYISLLKQTNGFDADEVRIYPTDELVERNTTYEVDKYCPEYMTIGDDGGGSAVILKMSGGADSGVYLVGHGVMTAQFMEKIGESLTLWLEAGCPMDELE